MDLIKEFKNSKWYKGDKRDTQGAYLSLPVGHKVITPGEARQMMNPPPKKKVQRVRRSWLG